MRRTLRLLPVELFYEVELIIDIANTWNRQHGKRVERHGLRIPSSRIEEGPSKLSNTRSGRLPIA